MASRREWRISGRVQGVWFRGATRERSRHLGLSGMARNLVDGSVQVIAEGSDDALARLEGWLHEGPEHARVDDIVEIVPPADESLDDTFQIG